MKCQNLFSGKNKNNSNMLSVENFTQSAKRFFFFFFFFCVEVLRPSQPNGVMLSAVSIPNHMFTGQVLSSKQLTSIVHILLLSVYGLLNYTCISVLLGCF